MITLDTELKREMWERMPDALRVAQVDAMLQSIATTLGLYFLVWLSSQQIMLVMGTGPVPTFAPPYVPVGPVVNGWVIPSPGHLMT